MKIKTLEEELFSIKKHLLDNSEVSMKNLMEINSRSYSTIRGDLRKIETCLMTKGWHMENKVLTGYKKGLSGKEIAKELKTSITYICDILRRFEKSFGERRQEQVLNSYHAGNHTGKQLGEDLSFSNACYWKRKLGLPPEKRGRKTGDFTKRDKMIKEGLSQTEIGQREGVCREAIRQYLHFSGQYEDWKNTRNKN